MSTIFKKKLEFFKNSSGFFFLKFLHGKADVGPLVWERMKTSYRKLYIVLREQSSSPKGDKPSEI